MRTFYISLILVCIASKVFAAKDSLNTDSTKTSLTLATIYSTNANYYGQTTEAKLPYLLTNATLRFKNGFSFSVGGYKLLNSGSGISEFDLGVGYDYKISKNSSGSFGYTRSFYPDNSPLIQSVSGNTASATLAYDWKLFNTLISSDFAFGDGNSFIFLTLGNSKLFDLGSVFSDKDYLSLEPSIEIVSGASISENDTASNGSSSVGGKKKKGGLVRKLFPQPSSATNSFTIPPFDLLSYNFKLPLAYNRTHYTIETSYQLSVLGKNLAGYSSPTRSFFNLSFYYMF